MQMGSGMFHKQSKSVRHCTQWPFAVLQTGLSGGQSPQGPRAGVTVRVVCPFTIPDWALMFEVPAAKVVASPALPIAFEIVAAAVFDEAQTTAEVRFWVLESV